MNNQDLMRYVLIAILLLCGYFYLYQMVARRAANKSSLPLIALVLLVVYGLISLALVLIISQMGSTDLILMALLILMAAVGVFLLLLGLARNFRQINKGLTVLFILYLLMAGYVTVFSRREGHQSDILLHFDSIEEALRDRSIDPLEHLTMNVAMFIPIGFLFPFIQPEKLNKFSLVIPLGLVLTTLIETTQLLLRMGQCDVEDLAANTLGACLGLLCYRLYRKIHPQEMEDGSIV